MKFTVIFLFSFLLLNSCRPPQANDLFQAVLWMQTSPEYQAQCLQTYDQAVKLLAQAVADTGWLAALEQPSCDPTLPPAVILDVDETVLDNSPYEGYLIRNRQEYQTESWERWCQLAQAKPIPGAVEFCRKAEQSGIKVFYVTNRKANLHEATFQNLQKTGFPLSLGMKSILPKTTSSDKSERRRQIAGEYRIIMLIGDNLGDMAGIFTGSAISVRQEALQKYASNFGRCWFILPNPAYGDWDGALFGFDYKLAQEEQRRLKETRLRSF